MSAARGLLLHGERWDVATVEQSTRDEMRRRIEELGEIDVVRSVTTGPDVFDDSALVVLIVIESLDVLEHYRSQPVYQGLVEFFRPLDLYPDKMVQFNIELPVGEPSLQPHQKLVLHGRTVDVSAAEDDSRTEIIDRMLELGHLEFVRSAVAGPDALDVSAVTQVMVFDGVERVREFREHHLHEALESFVVRKKLPTVSFSLELRDPPW